MHTNTRQMEFHPHVHLVMPAVALDAERKQWRTKQRVAKGGYLFNHKALAKVFRAKLLLKFAPGRSLPWFKARAPILCACCGAVMVIVKTQLRAVFGGVMPRPIVTQSAATV